MTIQKIVWLNAYWRNSFSYASSLLLSHQGWSRNNLRRGYHGLRSRLLVEEASLTERERSLKYQDQLGYYDQSCSTCIVSKILMKLSSLLGLDWPWKWPNLPNFGKQLDPYGNRIYSLVSTTTRPSRLAKALKEPFVGRSRNFGSSKLTVLELVCMLSIFFIKREFLSHCNCFEMGFRYRQTLSEGLSCFRNFTKVVVLHPKGVVDFSAFLIEIWTILTLAHLVNDSCCIYKENHRLFRASQ